MRHSERVGEIHCQGPEQRCGAVAVCFCGCPLPELRTAAATAAASRQLAVTSAWALESARLLREVGVERKIHQQTLPPTLQIGGSAHDSHSHVFRVSDRFIVGAGPWTLLAAKTLLSTSHGRFQIATDSLRTRQAVFSTVDGSLVPGLLATHLRIVAQFSHCAG